MVDPLDDMIASAQGKEREQMPVLKRLSIPDVRPELVQPVKVASPIATLTALKSHTFKYGIGKHYPAPWPACAYELPEYLVRVVYREIISSEPGSSYVPPNKLSEWRTFIGSCTRILNISILNDKDQEKELLTWACQLAYGVYPRVVFGFEWKIVLNNVPGYYQHILGKEGFVR